MPCIFFSFQLLEILLAISVFLTIHTLRTKSTHGLPSFPILGMLPSLLLSLLQTDLYTWITSILHHRNNLTFHFKGPSFSNLNCIITADPRNLEHLLKSRFQNFPKGQYFRNTVRDLLGDGIFNADNDTWQRQRKAASIEFHSALFRKLTTDSLIHLVHSRLIPVLDDSLTTTNPIDLQEVLLRLTFDNVCIIAFGVDPGCLRPGLPQIPFARAFEDATEATVLRFVTPTYVWKFMRWMNIGHEKKLKNCILGVDEFAHNVIETRKNELITLQQSTTTTADGNINKERSDLLTVFMKMKDEDGNAFSNKFLRDICVNFILAGRDTSSVALSWFFWLLDNHPQVENRILQEISGVFRQRNHQESKGSDHEMVFTPDEIKRMDYLQAALTEALRLYPSVPVDHKEVVEDDVFPDGTVLKAGTKVIYAIHAMGRMEAIWGKDCMEYKPERWLGKDGTRFISESAYKFTAFNGGPRLCLGKDFAYYQMKFVAASVISRYHVKVVKGHPVVPKLALTMYMKHGLKVRLVRRDEYELEKLLKGK